MRSKFGKEEVQVLQGHLGKHAQFEAGAGAEQPGAEVQKLPRLLFREEPDAD